MSRFIDFNANNKDGRTEDEGHRLRVRSTLLMVLFGSLLLVFFSILYQLQVVDGAQWRANANYNITQSETVDGVRGEILDRYGRVLVSNSLGYSVELDTASMGDHVNEVISQLLELCQKEGVEWSDSLPISKEAPWTYTKEENLFAYRVDSDDGTSRILPTQLGQLAEKHKWVKSAETASISAEALMEAMCSTPTPSPPMCPSPSSPRSKSWACPGYPSSPPPTGCTTPPRRPMCWAALASSAPRSGPPTRP